MSTSDRDLVFLSYSHADREWMRRLKVLLAPVVRNRRLDVWADDHIRIGEEWRRDILVAVSRARLAICLVTADFLASKFVIEEELPALRAAGVRVVPVLVHQCLWRDEPYFANVQWAHDPGRDGPLDLHNEREGERDRRLTALCERVLELIPPGTVAGTGNDTSQPWASDILPLRTERRKPGRVDGAPELPPGYVVRDELNGIRTAVLADRSAAVGVTGRVPGVGLAGQGGIGKTVLATALTHDSEVATCFPDGVFWVTLGEGADPLAAQLDLLGRLGAAGTDVRSVTQGARALREVLAPRQCLLIVDDVWSVAAAKALAVTGPRGRVVYTTRDPRVLDAVGAQIERVDVLSEDLARTLLARISGTRMQKYQAEVDRVLVGTGRVALALVLVAAAVRGGSSWAHVAAELDRGERVFGTHPYANIFKALQLATSTLNDADTELYLSLAVFPSGIQIPLPAICRYWQHLRGNTPEQTLAQLHEFADHQLLTLDPDASHVGFHDLQHDYLLLQVNDLDLLHTDLLAAYRDLLSTPGWWQLPADEPYLWHHLIHHLQGAGNNAELSATVTDPAYLITRTFLHSPQAAETDLRRSQALLPDPDQEWWQRWFGHYGHLLASLPTLPDTAATAALWLADTPHSRHTRRLDVLQSPPFLTALWGLALAPPNLRRILTGHQRAVNSVAFSPDGQLVASASDDATVRVWDTTTGAERRVFSGHQSAVNSIAFSPDGQLLASASHDGAVRMWDITTGTERSLFHNAGMTVCSVAFSPDGQLLAIADIDGAVEVRETATRTQRHLLNLHQSSVYSVAFSPDGQLLASASRDATVRVWDTTGGYFSMFTGHWSAVNSVALSPDGQLVASASDDATVRVWEITTGAERSVFSGHQSAVNSVAFSPDGQLVASASHDATVRVWDTTTGTERSVFSGHQSAVNSVAFSPDGQLVASASDDTTVRVWDTTSGTERSVFSGHYCGVTSVAFSPDGQLLASASDDTTVRVWDTTTGGYFSMFTGHRSAVNSVALSPDGQLVASASDDATVRVWDTTTGAERSVFSGHQSAVNSVAFSPDGQLLASASDDATVRMWEITTGAERSVFSGHQSAVNSIAFSPDGQLLASVSNDGTLQISDHATACRTVKLGLQVRSLSWHEDLLGVAADRSAVVLRLTPTPA